MDIPDGFRPISELRTSPFLDLAGPFYFQQNGNNLVLGLRVGEVHTNARGTAHGGLLLTMADVALGYQMAMSQNPPVKATTVSMSAEFLGSANIGSWLEAHVSMHQLGSRMGFANTYLTVGDKRVARASGSFIKLDMPA